MGRVSGSVSQRGEAPGASALVAPPRLRRNVRIPDGLTFLKPETVYEVYARLPPIATKTFVARNNQQRMFGFIADPGPRSEPSEM
jgi:hypothetical protein